MNSKRRKLLYSMALVGLLLPAYSMILSALKNRELQLFFSENLVWASTFAEKEFDFCKFEEWPSSPRVKLGDDFVFTSPRQQFSLGEEEANIANFSNTKIVDLISKKVALVFPHSSGSSEVKWDPEEKYAIALLGVSKDDFSNAEIHIGNLKTGKTMHLKDAKVSSCHNPGW
jgi:hypothetical protein